MVGARTVTPGGKAFLLMTTRHDMIITTVAENTQERRAIVVVGTEYDRPE